jgi:hypothetical protein
VDVKVAVGVKVIVWLDIAAGCCISPFTSVKVKVGFSMVVSVDADVLVQAEMSSAAVSSRVKKLNFLLMATSSSP